MKHLIKPRAVLVAVAGLAAMLPTWELCAEEQASEVEAAAIADIETTVTAESVTSEAVEAVAETADVTEVHVDAPVCNPDPNLGWRAGKSGWEVNWKWSPEVVRTRQDKAGPRMPFDWFVGFGRETPAALDWEPVQRKIPQDQVELKAGEAAQTILEVMGRIPSVLEGTEMQHAEQFDGDEDDGNDLPRRAPISIRDEHALAIRRLEAERAEEEAAAAKEAEEAAEKLELTAPAAEIVPERIGVDFDFDIDHSDDHGEEAFYGLCVVPIMVADNPGKLQAAAACLEVIANQLETSGELYTQADELRAQAQRMRLDARELLAKEKASSVDAETQSARRPGDRRPEEWNSRPDQSRRGGHRLREMAKSARP